MSDSTSVFTAAKRRAFTKIFRPAGFERGKHLFVRQVDGQIHGMQYQTSKWGDKYFVNVMFHYDFIPPLLALAQDRKIGPLEFDVVDFMFYTRLEDLIEGPNDWSYLGTAQEVDERAEKTARDSIAGLDRLAEQWRDPAVLTGALPPELIEEEERFKLLRTTKDTPVWPWLSTPLQKAVGIHWYPNGFNIALCLTYIAVHLRDRALSTAYLSVARSRSRGRCDEGPLADLEGQIDKL